MTNSFVREMGIAIADDIGAAALAHIKDIHDEYLYRTDRVFEILSKIEHLASEGYDISLELDEIRDILEGRTEEDFDAPGMTDMMVTPESIETYNFETGEWEPLPNLDDYLNGGRIDDPMGFYDPYEIDEDDDFGGYDWGQY